MRFYNIFILLLSLSFALIITTPLSLKATEPQTDPEPPQTIQIDAYTTYEIDTMLRTQDKLFQERLEMVRKEINGQIEGQKSFQRLQKEVLEYSSQNLNFWFAAGSFLLAVFAFAFPYLFSRKAKDEYRRSMEETDRARKEHERILSECQRLEKEIFECRDNAKSATRRIEEQSEYISKIFPAEEGTEKSENEQKLEKKAVEELANDENTPAINRLKALALKAIDDKDLDKALSLWRGLEALDPEDGQTQFYLGWVYTKLYENSLSDEKSSLLEEARKYFKRATDLMPDSPDTLYNLGTSLSKLAEHESNATIGRDLLIQAATRFAEAARIEPTHSPTFNNWGLSLARLSKYLDDSEAQKTLNQACEKYAEAARVNPENPKVFYNWGLALARLIKYLDDAEALKSLDQACEKYAEAERLEPENPTVFYNWGFALTRRAKYLDDAEALKSLDQACEKYAEAARLDPEIPMIFLAWGLTLIKQTEYLNDAEAQKSLDQACEKFAETARLDPNNPPALQIWGESLMKLVSNSKGTQSDEYIDKAIDVLQRAEKLSPGPSTYNLACLYSMQGNDEKCFEYLENSLDSNLLPRLSHIEKDPDLDPVRNKEWFKIFMEKARQKEAEAE